MKCPIPQSASLVPTDAPRRRVLLLTYRFPSAGRDAAFVASRRAEGLYLHLPNYGWDPVVLTARNDSRMRDVIAVEDRSYGGKIEQAIISRPAAQLERGIGRIGRIAGTAREAVKFGLRMLPRYLDANGVWSTAAGRAAVQYGHNNPVDLIWATHRPFSLAWAAVSAAARLRVPCVLDMRDPPDESLARPRYWLTRALRQASRITVAAQSCMSPYLEAAARQVPLLIMSGSWENEPIVPEPSPQFRIVHAGTWYREFNAAPLFSAMLRLALELPDFQRHARLIFIGLYNNYIPETENFAAVEPMVDLRNLLPYEAAQHELRQAAVLLLVRANHWRADGIGGKIFNYAAFQTPLLSVSGTYEPHGALVDWMGGGRWATGVDEIAAYLREQYIRWRDTGTTQVHRNPVALEYLSQQRVAAEFATVFDATVSGQQVPMREAEPWVVRQRADI